MSLGLRVVEVAHDFQQQIRQYVEEDLKMLNSYDTWHGRHMVHDLDHHVEYFYNYTSTICPTLF